MSQSSAQYHTFIKEILENQTVWTVKDQQGFPTSTNPDGETSVPFWSLKSRAEKIITNVPDYNSFQPYEITLSDFINKWLKGLEEDGLNVGVNWSGKRAVGFDINPKDIIERINCG
ncbi:DUF2750 domain-containing protein [Sutcliffiella horikoshii]|uniref:DUF2750 domain-containing protein n=1 Tax=Sutcliffiella horikoshii TaxID=79883 RepID=UPI001F35D042|nr:DUF2750 domain-containing protein [Sutcliffiella horikoshii]MCG1022101.1 DUF2750 domain-containing protein [Sutcliffiella horikoshii]